MIILSFLLFFQNSLISEFWELLSFFLETIILFSSNPIDETDKNSYNKVNW